LAFLKPTAFARRGLTRARASKTRFFAIAYGAEKLPGSGTTAPTSEKWKGANYKIGSFWLRNSTVLLDPK
jgi:hypothetical protein